MKEFRAQGRALFQCKDQLRILAATEIEWHQKQGSLMPTVHSFSSTGATEGRRTSRSSSSVYEDLTVILLSEEDSMNIRHVEKNGILRVCDDPVVFSSIMGWKRNRTSISSRFRGAMAVVPASEHRLEQQNAQQHQ